MNINLTRKGKRIQLMTLLFVIFLLISLSIQSLNTASKTIEQDIYDFSRGSYDILLRPGDSRTDLEEELGLVEENYLGIGHGGITLEQWQNVLNRDDVEVAAPVAAIGLYTANEITYSLPEREDSVRYTVNYTTTDGVHTYPIGESYTAYSFKDPNQFSTYSTINSESLVNVFSGEYPSFKFPLTYHQVVAIDVEEENKLTGEDFSSLETYGPGLALFEEVPILGLENGNIPLKASIQIDTIDLEDDEVRELKRKYKIKDNSTFGSLSYRDKELNEQLIDEMAEQETVSTETYSLDFSDVITPFYDNYLYADDDYRLINYTENPLEDKEIWGVIESGSQETYYDVEPVNYQLIGDKISVKQLGTDEQSGIPYYREIKERNNFVLDGAEVIEGEGFTFYHVGNFEVDDHDDLAASPLGIYGIQPTYLSEDRHTQIQPTAFPGSFITTPAHGLISIDWVERLKGDKPIDAIRVKIAGIQGYDQVASEKIKSMATEFEEQGFTVDIVAGASYQSLKIDVEGLGEVIQPWTTLGAADTILQSWDIVKIILVTFFILVSLIYMVFSFSHLIKTRRKEESLLTSFGWKKKNIRKLRLKEWTGLLGIPFILAFLVLLVISLRTEEYVLFLNLIIIFTVTCLLMFLVSLFYKNNQNHPQKPLGNKTVTWQNAWYYRHLVSFSIVQISVMSLIIIFLPLVINLQEKRTVQTTLGGYVHGQMEGFYTVLLVFLFTVGILTLIETLISLWKQRSDEMILFHHIGWSNNQMYKFYLKEVALWSAISILFGAIMSICLYQLLFSQVVNTIIWVGVISLILFSFILVVSFIVLINMLRRTTKYWYKKVG
ncbi:ABC transporter permease [Piscibacillus halophilus]|uniref:ABC transporter permease n=1 Tax=Piscibacillus halophilus TaxID=571933 RepID=UPI002409BE05|nr:FtsX-like permease family protein [Piscibacillus halophilus]